MSRLLPWHDTPTCHDPACRGPVVAERELGGFYHCGACGRRFVPMEHEEAQIRRAEAAWERVLRGEVHETKACARCGGCLEFDRFRLCAACVELENAERQGSLFPA